MMAGGVVAGQHAHMKLVLKAEKEALEAQTLDDAAETATTTTTTTTATTTGATGPGGQVRSVSSPTFVTPA